MFNMAHFVLTILHSVHGLIIKGATIIRCNMVDVETLRPSVRTTSTYVYVLFDCSQETLASANLIVRVGDHDFSRSERHQVDYAVARIVSHPNYFDATYDNDIALIRTTKRIKFSDAVKPICLAHTGERGDVEFTR